MLNKPVYRQELIEAVASGKLKISMIIFDDKTLLIRVGLQFQRKLFSDMQYHSSLEKYQEIPMGIFSASLTPANAEQLKVLLDMKKQRSSVFVLIGLLRWEKARCR